MSEEVFASVFLLFVKKGSRGNVFLSAFFIVLDIFFLSAETN